MDPSTRNRSPTAAIKTEVVDGSVLIISIDRPEVKNAINTGVVVGLRAAIERLDTTEDLRVGVLTGRGPTFCAGLDLREFAKMGTPKGVQSLLKRGALKPLVAAVEGAALGGGLELALMADLLVTASDAVLGLPEVRVGLFAGGGALHRLPASLPGAVVAQMAFTGAPLSARRAHDLGLVSAVTDPGGALAEALSLAAAIAVNAPLGVAASKALLRQGRGATADDFWTAQRELVLSVFGSEDAREGAAAFAERRQPVWRNR